MTSNNQLSTILLLILIGLAIYFLINPYNGFRNIDKIENFDDSSIIASNEELNGQLNYQIVNAQSGVNNAQFGVNNVQFGVNNAQSGVNNAQPSQMQDINSLVSQNVLSEIINESARPQMSYDQVVNDIVSSDIASLPKYDPNNYTSSDIPSIPKYDANDEDFDYTTSDLTSAFIPPLPPGSQPDLVDFKKNNVEKYNAKDFLPKQVNDEWFETDFSLAKYQLNDDKLINTEKYIIGINTVGESLKNATYDIRGTIPNPKFVVSPWNNSTYEPDFNLKPLC